ncbi:hypothetical protein EN817_08300 [Mesorhizobium sp. M3A.F.Ca.ET.174.01.1.1]|uniref:hypothetical protein n=1 Tax=unclassified Mesorhizobium TaxID=325217 RepID=UPI00109342ED|nr:MULTISPECIES: hypothetical protein [unclassified Mesorhizobium]TGS87411.1 hypothetical protein EN818_08300 [Mesorhizobium sp. M3A.F.Ca.ET.175.01.1.1]TGT27871.1 hypothetical protein EN817_08300 [Mesorhizobium sp. M3A.F.Ca.ET.174.01.1.1]
MSIATGIGGLLRPNDWRRMFDELEASPGLSLAIAFIAILFGTLVILIHPLWDTPLQIVISVIGWASFIEGLALLAIPRSYIGMVKPLLAYTRAVFSLLLGAVLLIVGFGERRNPPAPIKEYPAYPSGVSLVSHRGEEVSAGPRRPGTFLSSANVHFPPSPAVLLQR